MTEAYTFSEDCISDLHKDAHGHRPSQSWWSYWKLCTDDEKQLEWDNLCAALERTNLREEEDQVNAIAKFESMVDTYIAYGAGDRATAMHWAMEASDCRGDWDYFAWTHGLPYSYVQEMK